MWVFLSHPPQNTAKACTRSTREHGHLEDEDSPLTTVSDWIRGHPDVDASQFEKNHSKKSGCGEHECICGFCLASHYFDIEPAGLCHFCGAAIQETLALSDLPEILNQRFRVVMPTGPVASEVIRGYFEIVKAECGAEVFFQGLLQFEVQKTDGRTIEGVLSIIQRKSEIQS